MKDRIKGIIVDVGTTYVQILIEAQPAKYTIIRARAEIIDGPGSTVAIRVAEAVSTKEIDTVLEYDLTANPLDSFEEVYFQAARRTRGHQNLGTTVLSAKCNNAGNTVSFSLDIEVE